MTKMNQSSAKTLLSAGLVLCWVGAATAVGQTPPTMDGNLSDFKALVQQIQSQKS